MIEKEIKLLDVTGKSATQIENAYNSSNAGWDIKQIIQIGSKVFILAERPKK